MEIELAKLFSDRQICAASCSGTHLLTIKKSSEGTNSVHLAELESNAIEFKPNFEKSSSILTRIGNEALGAHAYLDTKKSNIFVSLQDEKRLVAFPIESDTEGFSVSSSLLDTEFEKPLFGLVPLTELGPKTAGDVVLAVSSTGELCAFCSSGELDVFHRKPLNGLGLERVLAISQFNREYVTIVGQKESRVVAYPLRFSKWKEFDSLSAVQFPEIVIPQTSKSVPLSSARFDDGLILGFAMNASACFILYAGGVVHIITPRSYIDSIQKNSLKAWYGIVNESIPSKPAELPVPSQVFQLSPGSVRENATLVSSDDNNSIKDVGQVIQLDGGYFAIGYGKYISIWDGVYMVGHALVPLRSKVKTMSRRRSDDKIVIISDSDVHELRIGESGILAPLSLGLAINRKGTCDAIISTTEQQASEASPMRAQPVTVTALKTAAEANESIEKVFKKLVKSENDEEMRMVRAVLSREATSTPEAVAVLTKKFTTMYKKVRRGNYGTKNESGLARLPSERLAAASVARCLYEIQFGNSRYVVPLIDMVGTGVVSSEAVLAVIGVSDSWEMGADSEALSLQSILDPLTKSADYMNAVEAIVGRVGDLCESDVVRVVQYAGRIKYKYSVEESGESEKEGARRGNLKSTRLLMKCLRTGIDKSRIVAALGRIPLTDVMILLQQLKEMLDDGKGCDMSEYGELIAPKVVRDGYFGGEKLDEGSVVMYRGVADWLDKEKVEGGELEGCIDWMCHLIDAHVSTLVLDEAGRSLVEQLLSTVQRRRREAQVVKGLQGLTSHLVGNRAIPENSDPLYKNSVREVPQYAALT